MGPFISLEFPILKLVIPLLTDLLLKESSSEMRGIPTQQILFLFERNFFIKTVR